MAKYFELKPVNTDDDFIQTAAILGCCCCGGMIDGMGGGSDSSVCEDCARLLMNGLFVKYIRKYFLENPRKPTNG